MNNIEAIDYAINDWIEDNDSCISRKSSEFPRISATFSTLFSKDKPFGNIHEPILVDFKDHPIFTNNSY